MDDSLTLEQKKSRRGLLAQVGAGGAAAVAALLGRSNGAEAVAPLFGYSADVGVAGVQGDNAAGGVGVRGESIGGQSSMSTVDAPCGDVGVYRASPRYRRSPSLMRWRWVKLISPGSSLR